MDFIFTDEQLAFRGAVRDFLEKECPPDQVRAAASGPEGWSFERWQKLADLGVVGLTVPEEYGGLGKDEIDLVLLLEEAGRACLPEPLAESTAIAVPALVSFGMPELYDDWLRRIAAGDAIATCEPGRDDAIHVRFWGEDGTQNTLAGAGEDLRGMAPRALDRGAFATAAVLCGIADRAIEMAASYAKERRQFGKPIGSFQAVKHLLADALLGLEFARPTVYRAAWSIARGSAEHTRDVSIAKASASEAAMNACRSSLQVHGAIGYTHEHDLHLWLNKCIALANRWGTAAWHRERVARAVIDQSP